MELPSLTPPNEAEAKTYQGSGYYLRPAPTPVADAAAMGRALEAVRTFKENTAHASWCYVNIPPSWRKRSAGDTAMTRPICNCARNPVARSLRRINGQAQPRTRRPRQLKPGSKHDALVAGLELVLRRLAS